MVIDSAFAVEKMINTYRTFHARFVHLSKEVTIPILIRKYRHSN